MKRYAKYTANHLTNKTKEDKTNCSYFNKMDKTLEYRNTFDDGDLEHPKGHV